jgi:hypothetical protein
LTRNLKRGRVFIISGLILLSVIWLSNLSIKFSKNKLKTATNSNSLDEERVYESKFTDTIASRDYQLIEVNSHNWIFNNHILQYSTLIYSNDPNKLYVECLVLSLDNELEKTPSLRCVLFWNKVDYMISEKPDKITIQDAHGGVKIYHVTFSFYLNQHDAYKNISANCTVSILDSEKNVPKKIFTQIPVVYDHSKQPRKSGLINCVHLIRGMNKITMYRRVKTWLSMFRSLGVDKVRFYSIESGQVYLQRLQFDNPEFVDLINYELNVSVLCSVLHVDKNVEKCVRTYEGLFNFNKHVFLFNLHERVVTNDCLIHSRFTHAYMTNMDVDEIISE